MSDFVDAISRVAHGGTVLDPEVVRQLLTASRRRDTLAALTPREREVLSLIAQGRSNAAIAGTLFISPKVVEKHVANNRAEAIRWALTRIRERPAYEQLRERTREHTRDIERLKSEF